MLDSPTILRRHSGTDAGPPSAAESDPFLVSGIRRRIAALAALMAVVYSIAVALDLALHASFDTGGLTSPARLKNVGMALFIGWVYLCARRQGSSLRRLTRLAYLMVFLLGLHQALESLHFFRWPEFWSSLEGAPDWQQPRLVDGVPWTCVLLVLFPPFVPGSPLRHTLLAMAVASQLIVLSAGWAVFGGRGFWSILSPEAFGALVICVALSLFISVAIHRVDTALRTERRRSRELGSYELVRQLGQGGMGEVWLARHKMLARPAALKLIKSERMKGAAERSAETLLRFEREARATAHLRSANTVELYDFGRTEAGDFYYVMELLDGLDLEALVKRYGAQPAWRVVRILRQVCLSLAEAHGQGMIHRDIKPANIFLCRQGAEADVVKVLDFGLVAGLPAETENPGALTRENDLLGTPAFMAPETVVAPEKVGSRSDLYAVGCVGYWLLAGRRLFEEKALAAQLFAHVHKELPSPLFPEQDPPVPGGLESLLVRMLAKEPADRPRSAREIMNALEEIELDEQWDELELERWWREIPSPVQELLEQSGPSGPSGGEGDSLSSRGADSDDKD